MQKRKKLVTTVVNGAQLNFLFYDNYDYISFIYQYIFNRLKFILSSALVFIYYTLLSFMYELYTFHEYSNISFSSLL